MNVLFVIPPVDYPNTLINIGAELGTVSLISQVRKECEVNTMFYSFEYAKLIPPLFTIDELLSYYKPDTICISVLTHSHPFAQSLSMKAKENGCVVIWGGIYVSQKKSAIIQENNSVDYYILGEGEYFLPALINKIKKEIKTFNLNISKNEIYQPLKSNENIEYELPDFSTIPRNLINKYSLPATLETTRGCKFKCEFCSLNKIDFIQKEKNAAQIYQELSNIVKYGFRKAIICDNNFIPNNEKFMQFQKIKEEIAFDLKLRVTIRLDLLNKELLRKFQQINIDELIIGIEHIDESILSSMKKTNTYEYKWVDMARERILLAADMGFLMHPIFMFGWPGETKKNN